MRFLLGKKRFFNFSFRRWYSILGSVDGFEAESWRSMEGLVRCSANYEPLSPIGFLERTAKVYRDKTSVVFGSLSYTWRETHQRCLKLASALVHQLKISPGDVIAVIAPNVPAMYELHFAVPMAGAVLSPINTLLDPSLVSVFLKHSEAKVIFVDHQLLTFAQTALDLLCKTDNTTKRPIIVLISQPDEENESISSSNLTSNSLDYEFESLLQSGSSEFKLRKPGNEWDPISINYTSGTTSRSKGVVSSHRGAYINSLGTAFLPKMGASSSPVYLWTVPMFHANGWALTWGMAAQGGTNICIREISAKTIFKNIITQNVTHMGGGPAILNMIVNSPKEQRPNLSHKIEIFTGGSPPPVPILEKMDEIGFNVSHLYGLTEITGAGTYCESKPEWDSLPIAERSRFKARQGLQHLAVDEVEVKDPVTMKNVPADGTTMGEIMFRGNNVMLGYLKDIKSTQEAFKGGWFHTSDLAVKHKDGYIEIKDRKLDLIISGGENVSTVEIEWILYSHEGILEAAVVARPDNVFGETACAFVKLKDGVDMKVEEIIEFCKDNLPVYMVPKTIVFGDLPRTSTGKVQKYVLRKRAKAMGPLS